MNQRIKRKADKRRRREICGILDLVLQINGLQECSREVTGEHPTVFFDFSGHVAGITVSIYDHGWDYGKSSDIMHIAYLKSSGNNLETMRKALKELAER